MQRRYPLRVLISALIVACCASLSWTRLHTYGLPFSVTVVDAHTAVIQPSQGFALPAGIQAGDRIDLPALDRPARAAITISNLLGRLPLGRTYQLVVQRDAHSFTVPITTADLGENQRVVFTQLVYAGFFGLMGLLALLTLWRGRSRAAWYMPLWLTVFLLGAALAFVARDGITGLGVQLSAVSCYLLARIIFYMMIETLVAGIFKPRTLILVRAGFVLVLAAGAGVLMGGPILYVVSGWAGLLLPVLGVIFTAGYLVPVVLLLLSYTRAMPAQRPHIRWLLVSSAALLAGIFLSNTLVLDATNNALVQGIFFVLSISGFVYTVLRHRVVDISVVIDRTLVYGSMTALVVGVLAAVNFVAQHAVLSTNASLALQIIVPLSIGIVLTQIRTYMNWLVERIFFRRRYLAEERLRSIARRCAQIERKDRLMETVTTAVRQNLGAIGVALYERRGESYICVRRDSEIAYPDQVDVDDDAFVAARGDLKEVDLSNLHSSLGTDGYVFPMTALGDLQGVLVCANRPGEHYAANERKLLSYAAHEVGLALHALRVRETINKLEQKAKLVDALATGTLTSISEIQSQARRLVLGDT